MNINWTKTRLAGQAAISGAFCPLTLARCALTIRREAREDEESDADGMVIGITYFLAAVFAIGSSRGLALLPLSGLCSLCDARVAYWLSGVASVIYAVAAIAVAMSEFRVRSDMHDDRHSNVYDMTSRRRMA